MDIEDIIALFMAFGGLTWLGIMLKRKEIQANIRQLERQVLSLQHRGVERVVPWDILPGYEITEVLGTVTGDSEIDSSTRRGVRIAELEALALIMYEALGKGADAIIGYKTSNSNCQGPCPKQTVSMVVCFGTAVKVRKIPASNGRRKTNTD
ncbi:MAG TPA: heavy metal-binding domain-containing protein [Thermodesulfovibrionales bacterium]|nr:heavy metal-binding domain-containing protein [Thermodesulfovibrionales bacterium]